MRNETMAYIKACSDPTGNHYPAAYWRPDKVALDKKERTGSVSFYAYRDADAAAKKLDPISGIEKHYVVRGDAFDAAYLRHIAKGGPNVVELAYELAESTRDTVVQSNSAEAPDPMAEVVVPQFASFFAGCPKV
jgi:hypothetical protein